jgi:hypothetical protein
VTALDAVGDARDFVLQTLRQGRRPPCHARREPWALKASACGDAARHDHARSGALPQCSAREPDNDPVAGDRVAGLLIDRVLVIG